MWDIKYEVEDSSNFLTIGIIGDTNRKLLNSKSPRSSETSQGMLTSGLWTKGSVTETAEAAGPPPTPPTLQVLSRASLCTKCSVQPLCPQLLHSSQSVPGPWQCTEPESCRESRNPDKHILRRMTNTKPKTKRTEKSLCSYFFLIYKLINDTPALKLHFNLLCDADTNLSTTVCA